jgi:hypothetical protein
MEFLFVAIVVIYPTMGSIMTRSIYSQEVRCFTHKRLKSCCTSKTVSPFTQSKMVWDPTKRQASHCHSLRPRMPPTVTSFGWETYAQLPSLLWYYICQFTTQKGMLQASTMLSSPRKPAQLDLRNEKGKRYSWLSRLTLGSVVNIIYTKLWWPTIFVVLMLIVLPVQWNRHHRVSLSTMVPLPTQ